MHRPRIFRTSLTRYTPQHRPITTHVPPPTPPPPFICQQCLRRRQPSTSAIRPRQHQQQQQHQQHQQIRHQTNPADSDPTFRSILDNPPRLVRSNRKHNPVGLLILATIPLTAFALGCWQVQRLGWKTDLIARFEDRLIKPPLPLPPNIDSAAIHDFDYRRVYARGKFVHEKEMLIGPRIHDGKDGYLVITPLERSAASFPHSPPITTSSSSSNTTTTVLVCRGWIPKDKAAQTSRPDSLPSGEVVVEGLLREPWKKNMFTPDNKPGEGKWYFPDVHQMAEFVGSQAVWIEETMKPDLIVSYEREASGIPIGRVAEVNLRNNHSQYIFTWFSLSLATSVMLWMVLKRPPGGATARVRQNKEW